MAFDFKLAKLDYRALGDVLKFWVGFLGFLDGRCVEKFRHEYRAGGRESVGYDILFAPDKGEWRVELENLVQMSALPRGCFIGVLGYGIHKGSVIRKDCEQTPSEDSCGVIHCSIDG